MLVVYSLTFAAVPSDGYLASYGTGIGLYNDQLKNLIDGLGFVPHLRATQVFAALSLVVFTAAFISCLLDYKADVITKRSAALHFCTSMFLTLTWVLELTLFTREGGYDSVKLEDRATLNWGFAVVVGASVITAVLGGVSAYYSMCMGASYVPQGQMMQSVPMQGYVPPQMQPMGMQPMGGQPMVMQPMMPPMQPAMVPAYQPAGQQQMMHQQAMPMNMQQPVPNMQQMAAQQMAMMQQLQQLQGDLQKDQRQQQANVQQPVQTMQPMAMMQQEQQQPTVAMKADDSLLVE